VSMIFSANFDDRINATVYNVILMDGEHADLT